MARKVSKPMKLLALLKPEWRSMNIVKLGLISMAFAAFVPGLPASADAVCLPGAPPQEACAGPIVLAGPAAKTVNFATPVVAAPAGVPVTFASVDLEQHNVVSADTTTDPALKSKRFWCDTPLYPVECPLFYSHWISVGSTRVYGIEDLKPRAYAFYCAPHPEMTGTLIAL